MPTFEAVRAARDKLIAEVVKDPNYQSWFRGAGMGFTADNRWQLVVYVAKDADVPNMEMLVRSIGYVGPYRIEAIGDITTL